MVVIPIIEELTILYSATGNLPEGSEGHSMDDENEEYEVDPPATPSVPAKHKSILS
ncbi:hypothetical protein [uncultured Prevotella sp.]|uniref:hypothetical protein n=1 Tax=uncultured Prevotella sp. TaxID=159272 RepID=UPI002598D1DB|nr:hypothetical protein [uncultured Prevotella sp.]